MIDRGTPTPIATTVAGRVSVPTAIPASWSTLISSIPCRSVSLPMFPIAVTEAAVPSAPAPTLIRQLSVSGAIWTGARRGGSCQDCACASYTIVGPCVKGNIGAIRRPCARFLILTRERGGRERWREIGCLSQRRLKILELDWDKLFCKSWVG